MDAHDHKIPMQRSPRHPKDAHTKCMVLQRGNKLRQKKRQARWRTAGQPAMTLPPPTMLEPPLLPETLSRHSESAGTHMHAGAFWHTDSFSLPWQLVHGTHETVPVVISIGGCSGKQLAVAV